MRKRTLSTIHPVILRFQEAHSYHMMHQAISLILRRSTPRVRGDLAVAHEIIGLVHDVMGFLDRAICFRGTDSTLPDPM